MFSDLRNISRVIAELGFIAALFFNSLLIYLTGWRAEKITGTYKHMLIFMALLGMGFSFSEMFSRPFVHNYNGAFVYFSLIQGADDRQGFVAVMLAVYAGMYSVLISSVAVLFIYRYLVLLNSTYINKLFHGFRLCIWLVYIGFFGFAWAALIYFCGLPDPYSRNYIEKEFETVYDLDIDKTPVFIILAYDQDGLRWSSVLWTGGASMILITQYIVMCYCGFSMRSQLNEKLKNFSVRTQRLQKQFFKTLVCQITVPTILFHMPIFPVLLAPFFDLQISFQSGIIYCLFSLYPPIDAIIILAIVTEYRRALSKLIGCNRKVEASAATSTGRSQASSKA